MQVEFLAISLRLKSFQTPSEDLNYQNGELKSLLKRGSRSISKYLATFSFSFGLSLAQSCF
jgi:hypothetical protein